jgi:hypothetical protein
MRLRDIAASLNSTERSAFGIITDLVEAGCLVKEKNGRRNRYHIQAHLPLPEPDGGNAPSARSWPLQASFSLAGAPEAAKGPMKVPRGLLRLGHAGRRLGNVGVEQCEAHVGDVDDAD